MSEASARVVRLVLVTPDGALVGALPPFPVATPWWEDAGPVVEIALERFGVHVTILRLLETERPSPHGGAVTYLAEVAQPVPAEPWLGSLDDHPLRMSWAMPGGPAADLAWAESMLSARRMRRIGPARQFRTWNLSSLWQLPVDEQTVWLKCVPPFFAHEGRMLEQLQDAPVPKLIAHDGQRLLLAEIPGHDLYDAPPPRLLEMVGLLVGLQREWLGRTDELLLMGLPDWRADALTASIAALVGRIGPQLATADSAILHEFVTGLAARFAQVAACGLPDTLVHGDFHRGNFRGNDLKMTLLDWGDSGIGHPLLDQPAFLEAAPADVAEMISRHWNDEWMRAVPGSDPAHAARLIRPIAAARQALIYVTFLEAIEPTERPYHAADPASWLRRTAALLRDGS